MLYNNTVEYLVRKIHASPDFFGVVYEQGAGVGVAEALYKQDGASNTVYASHSLYHKDSFRDHLNLLPQINGVPKRPRSVSFEHLRLLHTLKIKEFDKELIKPSFILSTTFQITGSSKTTKHGWVGLTFNDITMFYHLTLPNKLTRQECIDRVALDAIRILYSRNTDTLSDTLIDDVKDIDGRTVQDRLLSAVLNTKEDTSIFINYDKEEMSTGRIEDFLRHNKKLFVYKGSFNPWHKGHTHVLNSTRDLFNIDGGALCVSINTFQKERLNLKELKERIKDLSHILKIFNCSLIVYNKPLFMDFVKHVEYRLPDKAELIFSMGDDTWKRLQASGDSDTLLNNPFVNIVVVRRFLNLNDKAPKSSKDLKGFYMTERKTHSSL